MVLVMTKPERKRRAQRPAARAPWIRWVLSIDLGINGGASLARVDRRQNGVKVHPVKVWEIRAEQDENSARTRGNARATTSRGEARAQQLQQIFAETIRLVDDSESLVVVIEKPGATDRAKRGRTGSQGAIGFSLGRMAGMIELMAAQARLAFDDIQPNREGWRADIAIPKADREMMKAQASARFIHCEPKTDAQRRRYPDGWDKEIPGDDPRGERWYVQQLWPGLEGVSTANVAAAVLIGSGYAHTHAAEVLPWAPPGSTGTTKQQPRGK